MKGVCDYKNLTISFNKFHNLVDKDVPEYGEYCLLELKDSRLTGGSWRSVGLGAQNRRKQLHREQVRA